MEPKVSQSFFDFSIYEGIIKLLSFGLGNNDPSQLSSRSMENPSTTPTTEDTVVVNMSPENESDGRPSLPTQDDNNDVIVTLIVGRGGSQVTIPVDKKMLLGGQVGRLEDRVRDKLAAANNANEVIILLPDDSAEGFRVITELLQDNGFPVSLDSYPVETLILALETSQKYGMADVRESIESALSGKTLSVRGSIEGVVKIFETAKKFNCARLAESAWKIMLSRFDNIAKSKAAIEELSKTTLCNLLKNEELIVASEETVFHVATKWLQTSSISRTILDPTKCVEFREVTVPEVMSHIRFPLMQPKFFEDMVMTSGYLPQRDCELVEHYFSLKRRHPAAASATVLPFKKEKRRGTEFTMLLFHEFALPKSKSKSHPALPSFDKFGMKLKCSCTAGVMLKSIVLNAIPDGGEGNTACGQFSFSESKSGEVLQRRYSSIHGNNRRSVAEFDPPLTLLPDCKYILECFMSKNRLCATRHMPSMDRKMSSLQTDKHGYLSITFSKIGNFPLGLLNSVNFYLTPLDRLDDDHDLTYAYRVKEDMGEEERKKSKRNKQSACAMF